MLVSDKTRHFRVLFREIHKIRSVINIDRAQNSGAYVLPLPETSESDDALRMTGEKYIHSCMPKFTSTWRSRYFVVSEEMMIPKPVPSTARLSTSSGVSAATHVMCTFAP